MKNKGIESVSEHIFTRLIKDSKLQIGKSSNTIRYVGKEQQFEVDFYGSIDDDYKVQINAFGRNSKDGWSEENPTDAQWQMMQEKINDTIPNLERFSDNCDNYSSDEERLGIYKPM